MIHMLSVLHRGLHWCLCCQHFFPNTCRGEGDRYSWVELQYLQGGVHLTAVSPCFSVQRDYEDSIFFMKAEGEFSVALRAMLPRFGLSMPAAVQLPVCAVHNVTETTFPVCNVG